MWEAMRSGSWLTQTRVRRFAIIMTSATVLTVAFLLLGKHGTLDAWGRPIGTDFSNVWTAGLMANHGHATAVWDWPSHYAVQQAVHGRGVPFYGWHYPPPFLLIAALLALLPYLPAYFLWQAASLAAAVAVALRIAPGRGTVVAALGFPACYVCVTYGQNGFLTAALLGGGLHLLERRPLVAGVLLGCLCYKPQFLPLLPVLLIVGGRWRVLLAAGVTAGALAALTVAVWGGGVWLAFLRSLPLTRTVVIEQTGAGAFKLVSAFAAVRMAGGGVPVAYVAQGLAAAAAVGGILLCRRAPIRIQAAGLIAGSLLVTPYAFDYDMVPLGLSVALMIEHARARGWLPWERTGLAAVYLAPLFGREAAQLTGVPLNLLAIGLLWLLVLRRATQVADEGSRHHSIAMPPFTWMVWPVT